MKPDNHIEENINLSELVERLKIEDIRYAALSKRVQIIYWILIPVYFVLVIRHVMDNGQIAGIIGSTCFLLAMLIFALFFRHYYKKYKSVDYSQPTLLMLKNAAWRYKPFHLKSLWILLAILLIDAGLCLNDSLNFDIIQTQVYFLGAVICGLIIGLFFWRFRYKPIRDAALSLIREIEKDY